MNPFTNLVLLLLLSKQYSKRICSHTLKVQFEKLGTHDLYHVQVQRPAFLQCTYSIINNPIIVLKWLTKNNTEKLNIKVYITVTLR